MANINIAIGSIVKLIELKVRHMEMNQELWGEFEKLYSMMNVCQSADEYQTMMKYSHSLLEQMEETELPLAFRTVSLMQAVQCSAEWVCNKNSKGEVLPAFRSFYCKRLCCEPILSLFPAASRPRYEAQERCRRCSDRLKPRTRNAICHFTFIEIEIHGNFYHLRVDLPKGDFDFLRRSVDKLQHSASRPSNLLAKLKEVIQQNHKTGIWGPESKDKVEGGPETQFDQHGCQILRSVYNDVPFLSFPEILLSIRLSRAGL